MTEPETMLDPLLQSDSTPKLERLRAGLLQRASQEGLLDVSYRIIDSPFGPLLLAATSMGLVRIAFQREGHDTVLNSLASQISPRILRNPLALEAVARKLDEYFQGRRQDFDIALDRRLSHGFRRRVLESVTAISYGRTITYAALAKDAGNPKAVRATGSACASNPLPIVIPCHRVVRSDGGIGGYLGGPDAKRLLLEMESRA